MKTVLILRGVSGSGKSTLASVLYNFSGATVVSSDHYMFKDGQRYEKSREKYCQESCFQDFTDAINHDVEFIIVDNTNIKPEHFEHYIRCATGRGYKVFTLVVENRGSYKPIHDVPFEVLQWQAVNLRNNIILR